MRPSLSNSLRIAAVCFPALALADVPVPKQTFTTAQLYQPLRSFTADEIGLRPTFAAMHRGALVISGGKFNEDAVGLGKLTTWRLSQAAAPNVVDASRMGVAPYDPIFKSHVMGFSGELTQIRAGKFAIFNLTDPALPTRLTTANGGVSSSHSSCWAGKYIYTGGEGYGTASGFVDIWDVSNPATPVFVRALDVPTLTGFRCASVYALGNLMVVSGSLTNGVATFDLSNPTDPRLISVFRGDTGANTYTSYLSGNRLYGGGQEGGLYIYDITNPGAITLVSQFATGGTPRYPVTQDEFVHIANLGNGRYQKIRVDTNPPQMVANVAMPIPAGAARASTEIAIPIGNLAFIGNSDSDVTHPTGWLIPHDTAPDNRPPVVNAVRPVDNESNVATSTMIGVSFTDLLDTPSISTSSVIIRPVGGSAIAGTYSNMGGIVNFSPSQPLLTGTTYEVVIPAGGVKDSQGNAVNVSRTFRFSTGVVVDTTTVGLGLHYPLDETAGAIADDAAGTRDGTLNGFGGGGWSDFSAVGRGALEFDGVDDYVATPAFTLGSQFSFASYVRVNSGSNSLHTIVGNATGGSAAQGFKVFVRGSTAADAGQVVLETGNGTLGDSAFTLPAAFPFNKWAHLAVTLDRAAGTARIWIDGKDVTSDATIRTDFSNTAAVNWGRMTNGTFLLPGALDDARYYTRILNATDTAQLRDKASAPLAHWRLNTTPGDASPNGRNLTLSVSGTSYDAVSTAEGVASLTMDGVSSSAQSPVMELGNGFTFSAWVKIASGTTGLKTIAANGPSGYIGNGWNLFVYGSLETSGGRVQLETGNGTLGNAANTAIGVFPFDRWTHVAVGVDRSRGVARIYVDGVDRTADDLVRNDFKTNDRVFLGQMSNNSNRLNGGLDDVRIFGRWLEDQEIADLAVGKLLTYWTGDNVDRDDSGFDRVLTRVNGTTFSTQAARGSHSLSYDGTNDYAFGPTVDLGDKFTISQWTWMPTALPAASKTLFANSAGGSNTNGFRWFVNSWATNNMALIFETANGTTADNASAPAGTFVPGQWNHLAAVVDRTAGRVELYLNRKKVTGDNTIRTDFGNNQVLFAGSFTGGGAPWQGQLDDVRVYAEAVSDADLAALGYGSPNIAPVISSLVSSASASISGSSVTFTSSATDANVGERLRYFFDFGDGTNSGWQTSTAASHTYAAPGRYSVTVTITDGYVNVTRTMTQIIYNALTATQPSISSEMAYDATRGKVWCVIPDGDDHDLNTATAAEGRVVRMDVATRTIDLRVNLGANTNPVALAIRPGAAEVWVACKESDQVKIVNAATGAVNATLSPGRGYQPAGIAFAPNDSAAFVACEGAEGVVKYRPSDRVNLGALDLDGSARGVAVSGDSTRVFVSIFRSPNSGGVVREIAASAFTNTRTFTLNPDTTTIDAANRARGIPNYLSQVVISPDGRKAWLPSKKDNIFRGIYRDGFGLNHENTVRSLVAQLDLIGNAELSANRLDLDNAHFPTALCFSPRGDLVFAALLGNELVAVIDANTRATLPGIFTGTGNPATALGFAPSSLCVSPDGTRLFVHNFLERTIRVFDINALTSGTGSTATLLGTVPLLSREPLAANVLQGKKVFHNSQDPRLASEGYISCASCHLGGDHDGRVWDIGNFGEGLRNTIDLRGRGGMGHGALHWTANFNEVQDFEGQIRSLSGGSGLITSGTPNPPLGAANGGRSADLDSMAAYVASLATFPKSPFRQASGAMTAGAVNGQAHFTSKGCATCHSGTQFTDSSATTFTRHNIGTLTTQSGERLDGPLDGLDAPTLRAVWSTAPYLHRGQAALLDDVFTVANAPDTTPHARFRELTTAQQSELLRYLLEIE